MARVLLPSVSPSRTSPSSRRPPPPGSGPI
uniref:Uncharacterized protein n=1 Tax=Arundo donax TaxID=35708 RepID=A0A0A9TJE2_ARUDO